MTHISWPSTCECILVSMHNCFADVSVCAFCMPGLQSGEEAKRSENCHPFVFVFSLISFSWIVLCPALGVSCCVHNHVFK